MAASGISHMQLLIFQLFSWYGMGWNGGVVRTSMSTNVENSIKLSGAGSHIGQLLRVAP
jgi:hypothetical protein